MLTVSGVLLNFLAHMAFHRLFSDGNSNLHDHFAGESEDPWLQAHVDWLGHFGPRHLGIELDSVTSKYHLYPSRV